MLPSTTWRQITELEESLTLESLSSKISERRFFGLVAVSQCQLAVVLDSLLSLSGRTSVRFSVLLLRVIDEEERTCGEGSRVGMASKTGRFFVCFPFTYSLVGLSSFTCHY